MAAPSNYEQLILELINRARLDPPAEAVRLGVPLNQGLSSGSISSASKQPLAYNSLLNDAAAAHSNWMLAADIFSHTGSGGSDPQDRMEAAGYQFTELDLGREPGLERHHRHPQPPQRLPFGP